MALQVPAVPFRGHGLGRTCKSYPIIEMFMQCFAILKIWWLPLQP